MENFFKDRLREVRNDKDVTQEQLGKAIDIHPVTIAFWESGARQPSMYSIIKVACFFKVSTDYLLGLENYDGTKTYDKID